MKKHAALVERVGLGRRGEELEAGARQAAALEIVVGARDQLGVDLDPDRAADAEPAGEEDRAAVPRSPKTSVGPSPTRRKRRASTL